MDKRPTYEELEQRIRVLEAECAKGKEAEAALRASEARYHDQLELDLQNRALLELRYQLEQSLERYTELYDFAPVGYFTLSADGTLRDLNLAGAALLGQERSRLLAQRFGLFVSEQTRPNFVAFLDRVLAGTTREYCDVMLPREGMPIRYARLEGVGIQDGREWLGRIGAMDITDHKRTEAALRESEAWLELALSVGRMVAWQYDPTTRQVTFSKDAEKVLELPQRHETSDQGYALIHPDDVEHHRALVDGAIATGGHYASICRHVHGEQVIWLEEHAQAVVDQAGQTIRLLGVTQNITERKRAEEALRTREQHYRLLIQSLHSGVVVHAPDTEILLANEQAGQMLGLSVDAMTGKTAADPGWVFVREDGTPMPFDEYPVNRVLAERQPVHNLILGIRHPPTGDRVWVLVNATPEFDDAGQLRQVVVTFVDVTDRKQAEITLRESEARLQRVLDGTSDGFWDWNVTTGEVLFSGRWAEMLGYDLADIEPHVRSWEQRIHPDDLPQALAAVQAHLAGVTPQYQCEHRLRAKNGEWRWILSRAKITTRDDQGRPLRVSGTHTDITDAKIADRALQTALEEKTVLLLELKRLNETLTEANQQLQRIAETDGLLGIANRRYFDQRLEIEWQRAQREQTPLALLMIDVDYFKNYNDCLGHLAGDACLRQIAQVVATAPQRATDFVARYGGEELVVLLPNTTLEGAQIVAQFICQGVAKKQLVHPAALMNYVTVSIGGAMLLPNSEGLPRDLIAAADQALYAAKADGRDRVCFA